MVAQSFRPGTPKNPGPGVGLRYTVVGLTELLLVILLIIFVVWLVLRLF
jgi:hypothetical protein